MEDVSPDTNSPWLNRIESQRGIVYHFSQRCEDNREAYYIIRVSKATEQEFLDAFRGTDTFYLPDFGEVIASGYGPPPEDAI